MASAFLVYTKMQGVGMHRALVMQALRLICMPVQDIPAKELADLKKRKMIRDVKRFTYRLTKGPDFALQRKKAATDLTADMLAR